MKEVYKYLIRTFGIAGLLGLVSLLFSGILYGVFFKLLVAVAVAEIIWAIWFKPFVGAIEREENPTKFLSLILFRAILIGSFVIGACIGL